MQRAIVIGFGSIGQRHARILSDMGLDVGVVSRRSIKHECTFPNLAEALDRHRPDYVVVANRTHEHQQSVLDLAELGYKGQLLVEKPVFEALVDPPPNIFSSFRVGYNLRYHPLICRLRSELVGSQICSYQVYAGQYLPDWRPAVDYRQSYSSHASEGGGVLLDLSHELDYTLWLLGRWQAVAARGGHRSELEIDSADCFTLLLETERCPLVTIHLNYLDRKARREIVVNTTRSTIHVDLISGRFDLDSRTESVPFDRDETFRAMHSDVLTNNGGKSATLEDGLEVLDLVKAAEAAAKADNWVRR